MGIDAERRTRIEEIIWCEGRAVAVLSDAGIEANHLRWKAAELISAELDAGKTQRELAAEIGKTQVHVSYMHQVFKRFYSDNQVIKMGSRSFDSYYQEVKSKPREEVAAEVRALYAAGMSKVRISKQLGIPRTTARKMIDAAFGVQEKSLTHPENSIACSVEPASQAIEEIESLIDRLLGPVYTLSQSDRGRLRKIFNSALGELES